MVLFLTVFFNDAEGRTRCKVFEGESFGYEGEGDVGGEIVFQTGMVGYTEALYDPSYAGQVLVLTYPIIGSYGIPQINAVDEHGIPKFFESEKMHTTALVVNEYNDSPSHWNQSKTLKEALIENKVVGIAGIDTRELTKLIREQGTVIAKISKQKNNPEAPPSVTNEVKIQTTPREYNPKGETKVLVINCGIKNNQIRLLLKYPNTCLKLVPWDHDFTKEYEGYDRVFISNGPGNPEDYDVLIQRLKKMLQAYPKTPIFGICLGHQIMSLAAGFQTYKLKYGNRGHNIPCVLKDTKKCFITSQNHGYATNTKQKTPENWKELFVNPNDGSNEGIYHTTNPWFSVQFHPEAKGGPNDTSALFEIFLGQDILTTNARELIVKTYVPPRSAKCPATPKKVIILGSGGLSIGQSGEFDYSGAQAIKAYREEGLLTVLVNPNVATVQTSSDFVDKIYFLPVTPEFVEKVINIERPDSIALSFGGQTALDCGATLYKQGVFAKYNVNILGTTIENILKTEDRKQFKEHIEKIGEHIPNGVVCANMDDAITQARKVGFPLLVRSAFALGGLGSGFATNMEEFKQLVHLAFSNTTDPQIIIDKSLKGWKEIEYEVIRDAYGNCLTVCNMENLDPLGIHTGESIVVAPSQTLTDDDYNMLRDTALKVINSLEIVGECNIQYALDPYSNQYYIIEVNARLSRSSALASKATGYPLAYIAAKLSLGYCLTELKNSMTQTTSACFEPSLDYCVVKIPRWELEKFDMETAVIDSAMKSVGEGMAISRTFEEALQKAIRMTGMSQHGLDPTIVECTDEILTNPTYKRILAIAAGLNKGTHTIEEIHKLSKIDKWFLTKIENIVKMYQKLATITNISDQKGIGIIRNAKRLGFSDKYISHIVKTTEQFIQDLRYENNILPEIKKIDTVSAEFPCKSNYLYTTYANRPTYDMSYLSKNHAETHDMDGNNTILILGSGVYKIGSSVEFDWCTVNCIREITKLGKKVIMINCNPETVSTDYDEADKLYFDELSLETVMDIYNIERPEGVIISVGGQIPNNIAMELHRRNVKVLGTSPENIDRAENRYKFSRMLNEIDVDQPKWKELTTFDEAKAFCKQVGYPCLVRPSYVLSGAAMNIAYSDNDLTQYLEGAMNVRVSKDHPVVISKFIQDAKEIEVDAVSEQGWVKLMAISEHVENAGVHSGDATLILPAQDLTPSTIKKIQKNVYKISQELNIHGPFNIQFIAKNDEIKVIECNLRVSRSFPFISKTLGTNFIKAATRIMMGVYDTTTQMYTERNENIKRIGVKVPQFSFNRLRDTDILLGVDMKSTGEVACFGKNKYEAYLKALISTRFAIPPANTNILISIGTYQFKEEFEPCAGILKNLGYKLFGTHNSANFMNSKGIEMKEMLLRSTDQHNMHTILKYIQNHKFSLVINISERNKMRSNENEITDGYLLRRCAIDSNIPVITDVKNAKLLVKSLEWYHDVLKTDIVVDPRIDCFTSYKTIRIPGLIDVHVHTRDPGETYKEDWESCTKAALAGGITTILAMPNTTPAVVDEETLALVEEIASKNAHCDYGIYFGANNENHAEHASISSRTAGLKMYLNNTHGPLLLEGCMLWKQHIMNWSDKGRPICVHAESKTLAALLFVAQNTNPAQPIHICHVSTSEEINIVKLGKTMGLNITCEVAPHHLFLTSRDNTGCMGTVKPPLVTQRDVDALWENLDIIDCFATDHAPHTHEDKTKGCPGFAGLETSLQLLLTAVHHKKLTVDDIILRYHINPKRIFNISDDLFRDTYVEVDLNQQMMIGKPRFSKCGWSPFEGRVVNGCVKRVVIRGQPVFIDGNVINSKGFGKNIRTPHASITPLDREETVENEFKKKTTSQFPKPILKNIITTKQFTKDVLKYICELASELRAMDDSDLMKILHGKILGLVFYEPSTRTRCSFESAMKKLGGRVINLSSVGSSVLKGENLEDTVKSMESYCDAIVLRHPDNNSSGRVCNTILCPLINGGSGSNEHPTQAILDIYTIRNELGTLGGICITFVGDLKYGRTVHSLINLLTLRNNVRIRFVSPPFLSIPDEIRELLDTRDIDYAIHPSIEDVIDITNVLYVTRIQRERMTPYESALYKKEDQTKYHITPETLANAKGYKEMCILHPLPRTTEISRHVDNDPRAAYFRQMKNGLYVRMALLKLLLEPANI